MKTGLRDWGDLLIGLVLGVVLTVAAMATVNWVYGWQRVGAWQRALDQRQAETLEGLMLEQIERAGEAVEDDAPSKIGDRLAKTVFPELYQHYLRFVRYLLEHDQVDRFNQLRTATGFALLDLSGADLSGLDLSRANFNGAILGGADLRRTFLDGASFFNARLNGADFSGARMDGASFVQADMCGARLNGIVGSEVDFRDAVLEGASLTGISDLIAARFEGAVMAQANLLGSRFPEAVFDGADLTMASAVDCDLTEVVSIDGVMLLGANLSGAHLNPEVSSRLWLENAEGLSEQMLQALRGRDCVDRAEDLLQLVDRRIIAGFRAQLEADESLDPGERRRMLLDMMRQYWMQ